MKQCPECYLMFEEEYQFCPEDGALLVGPPSAIHASTAAFVLPKAAGGLTFYCPVCAAGKPLTFSACLVQHRASDGSRVFSWSEPRGGLGAQKISGTATEMARAANLHTPSVRPLSALERYEATLESLSQLDTCESVYARGPLPESASAPDAEGRKYRVVATIIWVGLAGLALLGTRSALVYLKRPAPPSRAQSSARIPNPSPPPLRPEPSPAPEPAPPPGKHQNGSPPVPTRRQRSSPAIKTRQRPTVQKKSPPSPTRAQGRSARLRHREKPSVRDQRKHVTKPRTPTGGKTRSAKRWRR